jgi:hypothetical protein
VVFVWLRQNLGTVFWGKHIPSKFIFESYEPQITKNLFDMQKSTRRRDPDDSSRPEPVFALFDDCMSDRSFIQCKQTKEIFFNGRHFNIFTIITAQYVMDIPPALRANVDFVFALKDNIFKNRMKLYENFFGVFPSFEAFDQVYKSCTQDNECIVLDNRSLSYNVNDCVFFYKATMGLNYRLGTPRDWAEVNRLSRIPVDEVEQRENSEHDFIEAYAKKKRKAPKLLVKKVYPVPRTQ